MAGEEKKITYLAIPYCWNPEKSFDIANIVAAELMQKGLIVFSPISHSHPISHYMDKTFQFDHNFWMKEDLAVLENCKDLMIISYGKDGDELIAKSKGCQYELSLAKALNLPITKYYYYD
jgi:hypothetical protein